MTALQIKECRTIPQNVDVVPETDRELVQRFVWDHCELAFEALIRRHGPMVMGVCRRVLSDPQDAEDAFQKTFLVLVQKCTAIRRPEQLASWLFGVAYRVSVRIRARAARRKSAEMQPAENLFETATENAMVEAAWRETLGVLDEEISRLPERFRVPLILCYLQGKTHVEVARELGCPAGSMSTLLTHAREALRRSLAGRGITFSAGVFAIMLGRESLATELPPVLIRATTRATMLAVGGNSMAPETSSPSPGKPMSGGDHPVFRPGFRRPAAVVVFLLLLVGVLYRVVTVPEISEASPLVRIRANPAQVEAVSTLSTDELAQANGNSTDSGSAPQPDRISETPSIPVAVPASGAERLVQQASGELFAVRQQRPTSGPQQFADLRRSWEDAPTACPACETTRGN